MSNLFMSKIDPLQIDRPWWFSITILSTLKKVSICDCEVWKTNLDGDEILYQIYKKIKSNLWKPNYFIFWKQLELDIRVVFWKGGSWEVAKPTATAQLKMEDTCLKSGFSGAQFFCYNRLTTAVNFLSTLITS